MTHPAGSSTLPTIGAVVDGLDTGKKQVLVIDDQVVNDHY